jgi:hypothetical protein
MAGAMFKRAAVFTLTIGVMYAQVCNVLCNLVENPAPSEIVQTTPTEENSHCHHRESSEQNSPGKEPQPQNPADSQNCPFHDWVGSLPSEISKSTGLLQRHPPAASVALFGLSVHESEYRPADAVDGFRFHPPPQITPRSILRI